LFYRGSFPRTANGTPKKEGKKEEEENVLDLDLNIL
jgi:hypothetical protein